MEIISDGSQFTDGKYEILYASRPYEDKDGNIDDSKAVCSLNGADVDYMALDLSYKIHWGEKDKVVDYISFTMPRDDAKLSHVFTTTPYGLIKKNRTGIGATTLELQSNRNSIVVVPTKSLAQDKAKQSHIEGADKYKVLYVGSAISGFSVPTISDYLQDQDISIKKFVVVADSLPRLLKYIGEEHFSEYFLMIDEIDSYQYDSSFRSALEDVLDYYWMFPETKRCLVSATIGNFSDKRIEEEPVIEVYFNEEQRRNINLIHTNSVEATAKKEIERIANEYPEEKILIAYNSVTDGIQPIIKMLGEELQKQCSVLCSVKSKNVVGDKFVEGIDNGLLPSQIVFMTCTYFVGIDIQERFHLISIANSDITHTLLSVDKLQQIAGRCRHADGVLSETIIYKTKERTELYDIETERQRFLKDANFLCTFYNSFGKIEKEYASIYKNIREYDAKYFVEDAKRKYKGLTNAYSVVRISMGTMKPAYLVIDGMCIQLQLRTQLYANPNSLQIELSKNNDVQYNNVVEAATSSLNKIKSEVVSKANLMRDTEIDLLIKNLRNTPANERASKARQLQYNCTRMASCFLQQFVELHTYVPFEELVARLKGIKGTAKYEKFRSSVIFFALEETHPLKLSIKTNFVKGQKYTSNEILGKINIALSLLKKPLLNSTSKAVKRLKLFCSLNETTIRINGHTSPKRVQEVVDYDVNAFNCAPLTRIKATEDVSKRFKL